MATEGDMPVMVLLGGTLVKKKKQTNKKGRTIQMIFGPLKGALLIICMIKELG